MKIQRHTELDVYKKALDVAMSIFEASKPFPREEMYSLTDQIRRSSRSVCANIAEGWRKRRYEAAIIAKLSDAESEAAETQVWLEFAVKCGYLDRAGATECYQGCEEVLRMIVAMINTPEAWTIGPAEH
jgi:four helix bundle protein